MRSGDSNSSGSCIEWLPRNLSSRSCRSALAHPRL